MVNNNTQQNNEVKKDDGIKKEESNLGKEELVQVKKSDLDKILATLDRFQRDQDLLFKSADKGRLAKAMADGNHVLIYTAKVSKWDGSDKYVIAWQVSSNRCEVFNGKWIEDQETSVVFDDGSEVKVPLLEFYRKTVQKESGDIISRENKTDTKTKKVTEMLTIQFNDGRKILINSDYIN